MDLRSGHQVPIQLDVYFPADSPNRSVWPNTLIIPFYLAGFSAAALTLHFILVSAIGKKLWARLRSKEDNNATGEQDSSRQTGRDFQPSGFWAKLKYHVARHGGGVIFAHNTARFCGCLILLGLTLPSLIVDAGDNGQMHLKKAWPQVAMSITYVGSCFNFFAELLSIFIRASSCTHVSWDSFLCSPTPSGEVSLPDI